MREVRRWIRTAVAGYLDLLTFELDDLEQDTLMGLLKALNDGSFNGKSRFETYVRSFAHHKCIDRLRSRRRSRWTEINERELPGIQPLVLRNLLDAAKTRELLQLLEKVPAPCREMWAMLAEGASYAEMAQRLGVAEGTLRVRVLRCRRKAQELRQSMSSGALKSEDG